MVRIKSAFVVAVLLVAAALAACSSRDAGGGDVAAPDVADIYDAASAGDGGGAALPGDDANPVSGGGPLTREDFNFYGGPGVIDADADGDYGGLALQEGWSTARGFALGCTIAEFAQLYDGLPCVITVVSDQSGTEYYPDAEITGFVAEISEENCNFVNFVFVHDGYALSFDYTTHNNEFEVSAWGLRENGRFQAFSLLSGICQYRLLGPYPQTWPAVGHLPWADGSVDEIEYLNQRNDLLDEDEQVFMFENSDVYLESYGLPMELGEQRAYLSSLSGDDVDMFDRIGLKIWGWVQSNLPARG